MKPQEWISLIRQAHRIGVKKIGILGGDPLCEPQLLELLLSEIKRLNMKPYLYTNGSLLSEEWIEKLKYYNPVIIIKHDIDNQVYQRLTRQKEYSLEDIEQRIRLSVKKGLRVITFHILLRDNYMRVKEIFNNSIKIGAFPAFERYLPARGEDVNKLLEINDQEYALSMNDLQLCYDSFMKKVGVVAARVLGSHCGCYGNLLSISLNGEILPCPYLPDSASLGNIRSTSLERVHANFNREFAKKGVFKENCGKCKDRLECGGGCFTYQYLKKGKFSSSCVNKNSMSFCSYHLIDLLDKG